MCKVLIITNRIALDGVHFFLDCKIWVSEDNSEFIRSILGKGNVEIILESEA